jgi:1,4-dihydroxy-2-naphthoate octaprenyltransferase
MIDQEQTIDHTVPAGRPPSWARKWFTATRAFALPASTMSVIFGTVLAVTIGDAPWNLPLFITALAGMAFLHTGANLLNDVYDFKMGIDRQVNPVSGSVVRSWITPREALFAGWAFLITGSMLGLYIVSEVGLPILWIGIGGVAIGVLYTWGPFPLKFNALGDLAVFLNFGVLGSLGAWTVQTGAISWVPAVWSVPMSLLVVGILHANNWRDIQHDTGGGIRTMASLLGDRRSEGYYAFLLFAPFVLILLFISASRVLGIDPKMPFTFIVTLLAFPLARKLMKKGKARNNPNIPQDFLALDGATAQLNLLFGALCVAALGLHALIGW